jgi:hypothetical protein
MNQTAWVRFPCGCKWSIPPDVSIIPRNCPDHWPADKPIKIDGQMTIEPEKHETNLV